MSDSVVFNRRDFLKLVGLGVAGTAASCARTPDRMYPFLNAPQDILPGVPYFYASTCRECPVGCGIVVKAREGRAIKVEGNPASPVGRGGLCARGQAGMQGLYDPDRVTAPMLRENGKWKTVTWDDALAAVGAKLQAAAGKVEILSGHETGSLAQLFAEVASAAKGRYQRWEPFGYEAVREANRRTFGRAEVPVFDLEKARCVFSFGADFLETFGQVPNQQRGFAAMRANREDGAGHFVAIEPRLSLTGANADEWVAVRPGGEMALALGIANQIVTTGRARAGQNLAGLLAEWTADRVAGLTDVPAETITRLAGLFVRHAPSLAIAGGVATQGPAAVALVAAVNLLNTVAGNVGQTLRFDRVMNLDGLASFADLQALASRMDAGAVDVFIVHGANPVYAAPAWSGFAPALAKVPFKVALSSVMDETTEACDVVLPVSHSLETIGDAEPARGVFALQQAAMRRVPHFDSRSAGDVLLALAGAASLPGTWAGAWSDYLQARWRPRHAAFGAGRDWETFWSDARRTGGVWSDVASPAVSYQAAVAFGAPEATAGGDLSLVVHPSANFYDGRGANKGWLQELPDMVSKSTWGSWLEMHPDAAKSLGVSSGDHVKVESAAGAAELPVYVYAGLRPDTVALALGQGHTAYGRYAKDRGVNAVALLSQSVDATAGALAYAGTRVKVSRTGRTQVLPLAQIEKHQHDRGIAQIIPVAALLGGAAEGGHGEAGHAEAGGHEGAAPTYGGRGYPGHYPAGAGVHVEPDPSQLRPGAHTEPMARPDGWTAPAHSVSAVDPEEKVRGPRRNPVDQGSYAHATHRWAMAVDLNGCTGCAACVVACQAENNIPVVGPDMVQRGRDMSWIRIDRFEEMLAPGATDVRFVPMMCQHCSDAPCEIVCPVYATYHNPEGLNGMVYNRCVGTRYCSNNCPYKARVFNWFDYSAPEKPTFAFPEPLNWQLNPDVTVRSKGVMEKCTMCVQRILEGKGNAKDEGRAVRDGEIVTACAQSCPSGAITFGDLLDTGSEVHRKSYGERRYWVLEELNTKPGVTYLQRVTRDTEASGGPA